MITTDYMSFQSSQPKKWVSPDSVTIRDEGEVPSRCSMAQQMKPRDASSPQKALYIRREQPTPWLNITSGQHSGASGESWSDEGSSKGAFGSAGKVVP